MASAQSTGGGGASSKKLRILHISDTHGLHRTIEEKFPFPEADILLHTGDYTNNGKDEEHEDFNAWLGEIKPRFKKIFVIAGNHEYGSHGVSNTIEAMAADDYIQSRLTNAHVLDHELVDFEGLKIFGSAWVPWHDAGKPGTKPTTGMPERLPKVLAACQENYPFRHNLPEHWFEKIPEGVDILMTHGPAPGIFDCCEGATTAWGSCAQLGEAILRAKPKAHLFGHIHEQRGQWVRAADGEPYVGGVDYSKDWALPSDPSGPPKTPPYTPEPPAGYPCHLISCNAMKNHPEYEGAGPEIAGPARLIEAIQAAGEWTFTARPASGSGGGLLVISDPHGNYDKVLLALEEGRQRGATTAVFIGDFCDNGPKIRELLKFLCDIEAGTHPDSSGPWMWKEIRIRAILGNHDMACLLAVKPGTFGTTHAGWSNPPYAKEGPMTLPDDQSDSGWEKWAGFWTPGASTPEGYGLPLPVRMKKNDGSTRAQSVASYQAFQEVFPGRHRDFLEALPWYYEESGYFFVHAGLAKVEASVADQRAFLDAKDLSGLAYSKFETFKQDTKGPDFHYGLPDQLTHKGWESTNDPGWGCVVVTGHNKYETNPTTGTTAGKDFVASHRIGLHSAACKGRPLHCAILTRGAVGEEIDLTATPPDLFEV